MQKFIAQRGGRGGGGAALTFRKEFQDGNVLVGGDKVGGQLKHEGELFEDPASDDLSHDGDVSDRTKKGERGSYE